MACSRPESAHCSTAGGPTFTRSASTLASSALTCRASSRAARASSWAAISSMRELRSSPRCNSTVQTLSICRLYSYASSKGLSEQAVCLVSDARLLQQPQAAAACCMLHATHQSKQVYACNQAGLCHRSNMAQRQSNQHAGSTTWPGQPQRKIRLSMLPHDLQGNSHTCAVI